MCGLLYVDDSRNICKVKVAVLRVYEPFPEFAKIQWLRNARVARISLDLFMKKLHSIGFRAVNMNLVS